MNLLNTVIGDERLREELEKQAREHIEYMEDYFMEYGTEDLILTPFQERLMGLDWLLYDCNGELQALEYEGKNNPEVQEKIEIVMEELKQLFENDIDADMTFWDMFSPLLKYYNDIFNRLQLPGEIIVPEIDLNMYADKHHFVLNIDEPTKVEEILQKVSASFGVDPRDIRGYLEDKEFLDYCKSEQETKKISEL